MYLHKKLNYKYAPNPNPNLCAHETQKNKAQGNSSLYEQHFFTLHTIFCNLWLRSALHHMFNAEEPGWGGGVESNFQNSLL